MSGEQILASVVLLAMLLMVWLERTGSRDDIGEAVIVRKGEWAVRKAGREARALSPETFEQLYEPAEEESAK